MKMHPSEPDGGWETAMQLHTTPIAAVLLCRYTAMHLESVDACPVRGVLHPDEQCGMIFWSSQSIIDGDIPTELSASVVRSDGQEPLFEHPEG